MFDDVEWCLRTFRWEGLIYLSRDNGFYKFYDLMILYVCSEGFCSCLCTPPRCAEFNLEAIMGYAVMPE